MKLVLKIMRDTFQKFNYLLYMTREYTTTMPIDLNDGNGYDDLKISVSYEIDDNQIIIHDVEDMSGKVLTLSQKTICEIQTSIEKDLRADAENDACERAISAKEDRAFWQMQDAHQFYP